MSDFAERLEAVAQIARDVRRALIKEEHRIGVIDSVCGTHLEGRWLGTRENFGGLVDATERSAIRIVGKLRRYLAVLTSLSQHDVLNDLMHELESLQKNLPTFRFSDNDGKLVVELQSELDSLRVDIERADCDAQTQKEIEDAREEVAALEQGLLVTGEQIKKLETAPSLTLFSLLLRIVGFLWGTNAAVADNQAELRRLRLQSEQTSGALARSKIRVTTAEYMRETVNTAEVLETIEKIERDLARMAELLDSVWSQAIDMLSQEISNFLTSAQRYKDDPSEETRAELDDASHEVVDSSGLWAQRAYDLEHKYAKAPKYA
ncbi:hypothetical protein C8Q80DRAFT_1135962 [Daedaleopsis nitida]|nr:hypothetical protein C8Q80DRAFT_1135962 [Daedaleopsis nitida]